MKKLSKHIAVLAALICLSISLVVMDNTDSSGYSRFDRFMLTDTASVISIMVVSARDSVFVDRSSGKWIVDQSFATDPAVIRIFNAIMSQVKAMRPVSTMNHDEIKKDLLNRGQKVELVTADGNKVFYCGGDLRKTKSYFANETLEEIYIVGIPGYQNYLTGIFELTSNQWRDRTMFNSGWRTIQSLTISYKKRSGDNLGVYFEDRSLRVQGVDKLDTVGLMTYVKQFENFQLNDYLDKGQFARYDSLLDVEPKATLEIKDINSDHNALFAIYPKIPGERFNLFVSEEGQMVVIDEERTEQLLASPRDFGAKE